MRYRITHTTTYTYPEPVSLCHNIAHLASRPTERQRVISASLVIDPRPALTSPFIDYFGNPALFFAIQEAHRRLTATAHQEVEVGPPLPEEALAASLPWERARNACRLHLEACAFRFDSPHVKTSKALADYAAPSFPPGRPVIDGARDLTRRINADFRYDAEATTVATPLEEVLQSRRGVCQDFAHLQIGCLRSLGLAARYVSGYLRTAPPPGRQRLTGADASHAWTSVYSPGFGWIDLDPTNDAIPSDGHVVLGWGRDFHDVSPIKGVILGGGEHSVEVSVDVAPA